MLTQWLILPFHISLQVVDKIQCIYRQCSHKLRELSFELNKHFDPQRNASRMESQRTNRKDINRSLLKGINDRCFYSFIRFTAVISLTGTKLIIPIVILPSFKDIKLFSIVLKLKTLFYCRHPKRTYYYDNISKPVPLHFCV